jgi:hypothetical protein
MHVRKKPDAISGKNSIWKCLLAKIPQAFWLKCEMPYATEKVATELKFIHLLSFEAALRIHRFQAPTFLPV